jgi:hypothetical protein
MGSRGGAKAKKPCGSFLANEKSFGQCRTCGQSLADHLAGADDDDEEESAHAGLGAEVYDDGGDVELDSLPPPPPPPGGAPVNPLDALLAPSKQYVAGKGGAGKGGGGGAAGGAAGGGAAGAAGGKPGACKNFTLKVKGSQQPNMCECGFGKDDHAPADRGVSQRISTAITSVAHRISNRFSMTRGKVVLSKAQGVPCDHFSINLASEQYGLCHCGFGKLEHTQFGEVKAQAQSAKQKKEEEARAKVTAKGGPREPCAEFTLDMANKEGYGYCRCGFPRDKHQDFKLHGEFEGHRKNLTKPKEFV